MEINKFPMLIVGVVVALVLAGAVLPVFAENASATDTFTNDGYYTMDKITTEDNFILTWDYLDPTVIDIDGTKIELSDLPTGKSYTIFGGDGFVLRYVSQSGPYVQYYGSQTDAVGFMQANIITQSKLVATVSNGSITFETDNPSYPTPSTIDISDNVYCINTNDTGKYSMKKMDKPAYVVKNTDIIILDGISSMTANDVGIFAIGTITENLDVQTFRGTSTYEVTFGDFEYFTSDIDSYINLAKLDKVEFTATQNNEDYTITYSYFIVPTTITAEKTVHPDGALSVMLNILPLLAIAGLVAGSVAWFITRK